MTHGNKLMIRYGWRVPFMIFINNGVRGKLARLIWSVTDQTASGLRLQRNMAMVWKRSRESLEAAAGL
jgi:hypothetical protein